MTREEVQTIAGEAADQAVRKVLITLGADPSTPLELQKDFAHLRSWRESTETIKRQSLTTAVIVLVTALLGLLAILFKPAGWPG